LALKKSVLPSLVDQGEKGHREAGGIYDPQGLMRELTAHLFAVTAAVVSSQGTE